MAEFTQLTVTKVGFDAGIYAGLRSITGKRGITVIDLLANAGRYGSPTPEDARQAAAKSDVGIVGVSSPAHPAEVAFIEAMLAKGAPLLGFADIIGGWNRSTFLDYRGTFAKMLICTEAERDLAARIYGARVEVTGNPAWDRFVQPAVITRRDARDAMGVIGENERVLLIPGTKKAHINKKMLATTLAAVSQLTRDYPELRVRFAQHPGDKTDRAEYDEVVNTFAKVPFAYLDRISADESVPGIDILVIPGSSSIAIHTIVRRRGTVPILDCPFPGLEEYLAGEGVSGPMTLASLGASYRAETGPNFMEALKCAAVPGSDFIACRPPDDLRNIVRGAATEKIVDAIRSVA